MQYNRCHLINGWKHLITNDKEYMYVKGTPYGIYIYCINKSKSILICAVTTLQYLKYMNTVLYGLLQYLHWWALVIIIASTLSDLYTIPGVICTYKTDNKNTDRSYWHCPPFNLSIVTEHKLEEVPEPHLSQ